MAIGFMAVYYPILLYVLASIQRQAEHLPLLLGRKSLIRQAVL